MRETLGKPLPRHAGHRVHGAAGQALHAADPHRQAHRRRPRSRSRSTWREDGLIDPRRGGAAHRAASLDQLLHPTLDPKAPRTTCSRAACRPRRARPPARRLLRRRGRDARREGRGGDPGADRDQPRGHPRHACRQGHPDHARRHDQPRGGGGARHGPALRRRRGRHARRLRRADHLRRRQDGPKAGEIITIDGSTGEVMLGEVPTVEPELSGDFATLMEWADEVRTLGVRANADTPARCRDRAAIRRRGHRPLPHRAHVLRRRAHRRGARDDHGRRRGGPPRGARQDAADAARTISSRCSASWRGCR